MGVKERQERERQAISRAILDAARELFVNEGYENVSIRKIAERIEYSPAAIYSYFRSKDDIFFALAEEGFRLLRDRGPASGISLNSMEPLEHVRAVFWRLYRFSREHPQYFALMFVDRSVPRISREYERFAFAREMKDQLIGLVRQCIATGVFPESVPPKAVVGVLFSAVLGIATLQLSDRIGPGEDPDELAEDCLNAAIAGLRAGAVGRRAAGIFAPGDMSAQIS
jgi:AcrR family transcriptional regulator